MKRLGPVLLVLISLSVCCGAWASNLQYWTDWASLPPETVYDDYGYIEPSSTVSFSNASSIEVLPSLDGASWYATYGTDPSSDFTGQIDEFNNGTVTFNKPGPYGVRVTYTDASQYMMYYNVGFLNRGDPPPAKPAPYQKTDTPAPDIVIVDSNDYQVKGEGNTTVTENLKDSEPTYGAGTTKVEEKSWAEVLNYLKKLPDGANKHVELGAHGAAGQLYWGGSLVLDQSTLAQLDALKTKVKKLTFMACAVGANEAFIQSVANKLGASAGYTTSVGGNGSHWFIWDNGTLVSKTAIPEPITASLFVFAGMTLFRRRRAA